MSMRTVAHVWGASRPTSRKELRVSQNPSPAPRGSDAPAQPPATTPHLAVIAPPQAHLLWRGPVLRTRARSVGGVVGEFPPALAGAVRLHAVAALVAGLATAALALGGSEAALWSLLAAVIAGGGALTACILVMRWQLPGLGALALIGAQAGLLAWVMEITGPRVSLLTWLPALVFFALRLAGPWVASLALSLYTALYLAFVALGLFASLTPALALTSFDLIVLDTCLTLAGSGLTLIALAGMRSALLSAQAAHAALDLRLARQQELRDLGLRQIETDGARLRWALAEGLRGGSVHVPVSEPALASVATLVAVTSSRLVTLQRDREERIRLEGAIRQTVAALGRFESPLALPQTTGTALDQLTLTLRRRSAALWLEGRRPRRPRQPASTRRKTPQGKHATKGVTDTTAGRPLAAE